MATNGQSTYTWPHHQHPLLYSPVKIITTTPLSLPPKSTTFPYQFQPLQTLPLPPRNLTMLEGKAVIGETDMLQTMQQHALHVAAKALNAFDITDSTNVACYVKKEFDQAYGPGWQCIVGMDFGSFVTHCCGCFIYFCIGSLAIMLFKGVALGPEANMGPFHAMEAMEA